MPFTSATRNSIQSRAYFEQRAVADVGSAPLAKTTIERSDLRTLFALCSGVFLAMLTFIGGRAGWQTAFSIVGVVTLGAAWLALAWLPTDGPQQRENLRVRDVLAAYQPLFCHGPTPRLYGVTVLRAICWYGMLTYFAAFLGQELGLSTDRIGIVYMFGGIGYFLGGLVAGGPLGQVAPRTLLVAGNVALALNIGLAYSGALGTIGCAAILPLAAFAGSLGWVALAAALARQNPSHPAPLLPEGAWQTGLASRQSGPSHAMPISVLLGSEAGQPATHAVTLVQTPLPSPTSSMSPEARLSVCVTQ